MTFGAPVVRLWSALATVLATAALVDGASEFLSNAGLLGGAALRDDHQESLLPVGLAAVLVLFALALTVALRAGRRERVALATTKRAHRIAEAAATLVATFLTLVLMETFETRFGGRWCFDPQSVLLAHAPAVCAAFAIVATIVGGLLRCALHVAAGAGTLAASVLVRLVAIDRVAAPATWRTKTLCLVAVRLPLQPACGGSALRAPPALA